MKDIDKIKVAFIAVFTGINSFLGTIAMPFYILVFTNLMDYGTGIAASVYRGEQITSKKGLKGIIKKVCMWLLVAVGWIMDYCIIQVSATMGITITFKCRVAVAVIFWLIFNELISILENIHDIGVPMPDFLVKLAQHLKEKTEETTGETIIIKIEDVKPGVK